MALNDDIADALRSRTISLLRTDAGLRRLILRDLDALAKEIVKIMRSSSFADRTAFDRVRMEELLATVEATILQAFQAMSEKQARATTQIAEIEAGWAARMVNRAANIELLTAVPSAQQLRTLTDAILIEGNPASRYWEGGGRKFANAFAAQVRMGVMSGETTDDIVRRVVGGKSKGRVIPGIMGATRRDATALVRTAVQSAAAEARMETYRQNSDVIKGYRQLSTMDGRTTKVCLSYSGAMWNTDYEPMGGNKLPYNNGCPRHFNCRSVILPITKSYRELGLNIDEVPKGTRASMDGSIPSDETMDAFLKRKGEAFQDQLLGPTRAKMVRDGTITLQDLVDQSGRELTIEQLRNLSA
jgi:SPP1 gp7 family putative phage head morphogenesis protein